MASTVVTQNSSIPFWYDGTLYCNNASETLFKDATRTAVLAKYTVLARIAATGKLVPLADVTAVDGTAIPYGIYIGEDIPAATIAAADVTGLSVLTGGCAVIDEDQIVLENSYTLLTPIIAATPDVFTTTIGQELSKLGFFFNSPIDISGQQS